MAEAPVGRMLTARNRFSPWSDNRRLNWGSTSLWAASASRFWISEVMKTVLPARLRPVTASLTTSSLIARPSLLPAVETMSRKFIGQPSIIPIAFEPLPESLFGPKPARWPESHVEHAMPYYIL